MGSHWVVLVLTFLAMAGSGCASIPEAKIKSYEFPVAEAYVETPPTTQPYVKIGTVRAKVDYPAFHPDWDEDRLCRNYYNKAVRDLVKRSKDAGGDAVIEIRSVTFTIDGKSDTHTTPECSEDNELGQILLQGRVIRWRRADEVPSGTRKRRR